jgi:hypothetical protein
MPTRAALVLLLVLNAGVAAWWLLHPAPDPVAAVLPASAPRLQLLAEAAPVVAPVAARAPAPKPPARAVATGCNGPDAGADGWRVYLPRLPGAEAADAMAARIDAAGFSDYLVMRDGEDANTIALGRYSTRDAAQRRTASLQAAGFPARCARIPASTPA